MTPFAVFAAPVWLTIFAIGLAYAPVWLVVLAGMSIGWAWALYLDEKSRQPIRSETHREDRDAR